MRCLVVPGTTLVADEIVESLKFAREIELFGAGIDVEKVPESPFSDYFFLPKITSETFINHLMLLVAEHAIDFVIPAHDDLIRLESKFFPEDFARRLVTPGQLFSRFAGDKLLAYSRLKDLIPVPRFQDASRTVGSFAGSTVLKPSKGQGSRGVYFFQNPVELQRHLKANKILPGEFVLSEFLPGKEYTVDVFSKRKGRVDFLQVRERVETIGGRATRSDLRAIPKAEEIAMTIARELNPFGAWFFQLREDSVGVLNLLELGARVAGGSSLARARGVNLSLLNLLSRAGEVRIPNPLESVTSVHLDSSGKFKSNRLPAPDSVFFDLDDTLADSSGLPISDVLASFLKFRDARIPCFIVTRSAANPREIMTSIGIGADVGLIHLLGNNPKSEAIRPWTSGRSVFVDDSFSERLEVSQNVPNCLVVSPEGLGLLNWGFE